MNIARISLNFHFMCSIFQFNALHSCKKCKSTGLQNKTTPQKSQNRPEAKLTFGFFGRRASYISCTMGAKTTVETCAKNVTYAFRCGVAQFGRPADPPRQPSDAFEARDVELRHLLLPSS